MAMIQYIWNLVLTLITYIIHKADSEERFDPCSAFPSSHLPTVLVAFPGPLAFMKE